MELKDAANHAKVSAAYLVRLRGALTKLAEIDKIYQSEIKAAEKLALRALKTAGAAYTKLFTDLDKHFVDWETQTQEIDEDREIDGAVDPTLPSEEVLGGLSALSASDAVASLESAFAEAADALTEGEGIDVETTVTGQIKIIEELQKLAEDYEEPEDDDEEEDEDDEDDDLEDDDEDDDEEE